MTPLATPHAPAYDLRQVLVTPNVAVPRPDSCGFFVPHRLCSNGESGLSARTVASLHSGYEALPARAFVSAGSSLECRSNPA